MQAHNSCCAAYGDYFSENLYYLFRQLHLSFPTTSSVFCDCILRIILWYHTLACISIPSSFCSSTRLVSELVGAKAPNTTLSAMLMMYLFLAKALCLELRGRWEREILAYKEFIFVTVQNTNNPLKIKGNIIFFVDLPGNIWYFENFCVFLHKNKY